VFIAKFRKHLYHECIETYRSIKPHSQCFVILHTLVLYVDAIVLVATQKLVASCTYKVKVLPKGEVYKIYTKHLITFYILTQFPVTLVLSL